jgi:hypothetical protein
VRLVRGEPLGTQRVERCLGGGHPFDFARSGCGFWFYPDKDNARRMLNSVRWELLAEGYDDYDYLVVLENAYRRTGGRLKWGREPRNVVRNVTAHVVGGSEEYLGSRRMSDVFRVRQALAKEIQQAERAPLLVVDVGRNPDAGGFLVMGKAEPGSTVVVNGGRVATRDGAFERLLAKVDEEAPIRVRASNNGQSKEILRYVPREFPKSAF